jgi:hypothetical protein
METWKSFVVKFVEKLVTTMAPSTVICKSGSKCWPVGKDLGLICFAVKIYTRDIAIGVVVTLRFSN